MTIATRSSDVPSTSLAGRNAWPTLRRYWASFAPYLAKPGFQIGLLLVVAVLTRMRDYGNPVVHVDDEFYLLVGDRLLHGAIPFVDVWDRKPIGLFVLYASIRLLGGSGIVQYQIVATLFAAATAFVACRMALRIAPPLGALLGGVAYLVFLGAFGGEAGQSPVFYNLFTAAAAWLTLRVLEKPEPSVRELAGTGTAVMLIIGLAIQIKYTVLFEGIWFGLALLWAAWGRVKLPVWIALGALWVAAALLPTIAAFAVYAAMGYAQQFIFANFTSVFGREGAPAAELLKRLWFMVKNASMLLVCAALAFWALPAGWSHSPLLRRCFWFLYGWCLAAIFGLLIFGTYFDHYALPVLLPLSIAAAPVFGAPWLGVGLIIAQWRVQVPLALVALLAGEITANNMINHSRRARGHGKQVAQMVKAIMPNLKNCMFVYDAEPILYYLTGSCFPSPIVFPDHYNNKVEAHALGVDQGDEIRRILANKPEIVVTTDRAVEKTNHDTWRIVVDAMAKDYHSILEVRVGDEYRIVYKRNS